MELSWKLNAGDIGQAEDPVFIRSVYLTGQVHSSTSV